MATEIEQIEDIIISTIKTVPAIVTECNTWQGDIADLISQPQRHPAVWVVYQGCTFGEKRVISSNIVMQDMRFVLALIVRNLRSRKDGSRGAYQLIEDIRGRLKGKSLSPLDGYLWPVKEDLVLLEAGVFAYGLEYMRRINE